MAQKIWIYIFRTIILVYLAALSPRSVGAPPTRLPTTSPRLTDCVELRSGKLRSRCRSDVSLAQGLLDSAKGRAIVTPDYEVFSEPACRRRAVLRNVALQLEVAISELPRLLDRPWRYRPKLRIFLVETSDRAHVFGGPGARKLPIVFIPCRVARRRAAPIIHEASHVLIDGPGVTSLQEGLADYLQFHLRPGRPAAFVKGEDAYPRIPCAMQEKARSLTSDELAQIGAASGESWSTADERVAFYGFSRSFVAYLVAQRSLLAVVRVIDGSGRDEAYEGEFGKDRAKLVREWQNQLAFRRERGCT